MIDQERALQLLGAGLKPADVSVTLGCDPSFISQLLMDDGFRQQVLALRIENLQAQTIRDRNIDTIEDELIVKLHDSIKYMIKPRDILMAFNIVNAAKRRGAASSGGDINLTQQVVTINLPPAAKEHFFPRINAQGEVVAVGQQVTVTKSLQQLMHERTQVKLQERKSNSEELKLHDAADEKRTGASASPATASS